MDRMRAEVFVEHPGVWPKRESIGCCSGALGLTYLVQARTQALKLMWFLFNSQVNSGLSPFWLQGEGIFFVYRKPDFFVREL